MSTFHSVPQKLPTLDSKLASSGLFNIAQGLPVKQLSLDAHSSPFGQGKLFAQSLVWPFHEMPQKFVLIIGALDGDEVIGALDGEITDATGSFLANSGCSASFEDGGRVGCWVGFEDGEEFDIMVEATGSLGVGIIVGFRVGGLVGCSDGLGVGFGVGRLVGCLDGFGVGGEGGGPLAIVADSYSTAQLGTEKHPSCSAQKLDAKPPGQGLLCKQFSAISANMAPQKKLFPSGFGNNAVAPTPDPLPVFTGAAAAAATSSCCGVVVCCF
mmetsp:Transcript_7879/g.14156  ORF Transcript_7879/g.14156 Transcript_7879/m.14156 type:complete len:269 (-) Transcript_7879:250-1056(-)